MSTTNDTTAPAAPAAPSAAAPMTAKQADTMISLLTQIRDELQRPRLERERFNERGRAQILEQEAARRAAAAAAEVEREARANEVQWAGGAGGG